MFVFCKNNLKNINESKKMIPENEKTNEES